MQIEMIQHLFDEGVLVNARIVPAPLMPDKFFLEFVRTSGNIERLSLARKKKDRVYKTIDSAAKKAREVGFRNVNVLFD